MRSSHVIESIFFEDKLKAYFQSIKTVPHTRNISGFHLLEDIKSLDRSTYNASIFRIIIIDDCLKIALIKDIEYVDNGDSEKLSIWAANLNYEKVVKTISDYGNSKLIETAGEMIDILIPDHDIDLN